jgi:hypothetical protein
MKERNNILITNQLKFGAFLTWLGISLSLSHALIDFRHTPMHAETSTSLIAFVF